MLACGPLSAWLTAHRSTILATLACAVAYTYAAPYFPRLNNPNENVRVQMTAALVEHGTYRIDAIRARWGYVNDAACVDSRVGHPRLPCEGPTAPPGYERHLYSVKAPLGSWLGVPAYALLRLVRGEATTMDEAVRACRLGGAILPMLLLLVWARRFFERDLAASRVALETGFYAVAVGSVLLGYGLLFVSHSESALVAFVAFTRLALARRRGSMSLGDAAVTGLLASATTALEYPCVFVTLVLCLWALTCVRGLSRLVAFAAGALVPVLLVMHFQQSAFGSPFRPGHLFVENPGFRAFHQQGFFGADGFHLDAAARLLVDPKLGLFTTTPFFLLAPIGALRLLADTERRQDAIVVIAILAVLYVPVTLLSNWDGGWVIGPRYLVAAIPFVGWLAAHGSATLCKIGSDYASIPLGLLLASIIVSGIMSTYYPHLPPEIRAPLADIYLPLIRSGLAPANIGMSFGLSMARSMLPLAAFGLGLWASTSRGLGGRGAVRALVLALPIAFACVAPSIAVTDTPPAVAQAQRFVAETWDPPPVP